MQITIIHPETNVAYTYTTEHAGVTNNVPVVLVDGQPIYYSVTMEDNGYNEVLDLHRALSGAARRALDPSRDTAPTPHYLDVQSLMAAAYFETPYCDAVTRQQRAAEQTVDTLDFLSDVETGNRGIHGTVTADEADYIDGCIAALGDRGVSV